MASEKDSLTKRFMERPEVFADAFNLLIYRTPSTQRTSSRH